MKTLIRLQADLGLRCPHMPGDRFSHGVAHLWLTWANSVDTDPTDRKTDPYTGVGAMGANSISPFRQNISNLCSFFTTRINLLYTFDFDLKFEVTNKKKIISFPRCTPILESLCTVIVKPGLWSVCTVCHSGSKCRQYVPVDLFSGWVL